MTPDQIAEFIIMPLGILMLAWSLRRIRQDLRGLGGLPGMARKLGYAVGRLRRRFD